MDVGPTMTASRHLLEDVDHSTIQYSDTVVITGVANDQRAVCISRNDRVLVRAGQLLAISCPVYSVAGWSDTLKTDVSVRLDQRTVYNDKTLNKRILLRGVGSRAAGRG